VDIDSTTGREGAACAWLSAALRRLGYHVTEQPLGEGGRRNLLAVRDEPVVILSTHVDCVPPFFPSRIEGDRLFGRGASDAKGSLAAEVAAAERLHAGGERRVGLLFVVGEEHGSDGAMAACALARSSSYLVNGEPTDNRLGVATRGVYRVKLVARGRAAHSSRPDQGESAIEKLVTALWRLRAMVLPSDPVLGRTYYSVGLVSGGVAPNVIPPHAEAEVLFRSVGEAAAIRDELTALEPGVAIEDVLTVPPARMEHLDGFETAVFPFTTDIPFLSSWGRPVLFGPGSALAAHTDDEHVRISELLEAAEGYVRIARALLARDRPGSGS
jgi:acetylornithine deacetylase